MNLEDYDAINKLENEMIADKLKEGVTGIEFLFENIKEDDMHLHSNLLAFACVQTREEISEFSIDSLKMNPDEFYNKYGVNFWISRNMNIQMMADEYKEMGAIQKVETLQLLEKKLKEAS